MSELAPQFSVDSATGIDVSLPVAGAGARSYGFVVDWHIRVVLTLAWYGGAGLLYNYLRDGSLSAAPPPAPDARWFGWVLVPSLVLYFLYHPVVELAMRGSTPGKRLAGVRVVTRDGGAPGAGALLVRNVFRLVDSLPLAYGVGLLLVGVTREHVRSGDMAAGTLLIYEAASPKLAVTPATTDGGLDVDTAELAAELLSRWARLTVASRITLARQLLTRCGRTSDELAPLDEGALRAVLVEMTRAEGAAT